MAWKVWVTSAMGESILALSDPRVCELGHRIYSMPSQADPDFIFDERTHKLSAMPVPRLCGGAQQWPCRLLYRSPSCQESKR